MTEMFRFKCKECGAKLEASYEDEGRRAACWSCDVRFIITVPKEECYTVPCPDCGTGQQVTSQHKGRKAECWKCQCVFMVPPPEAATSADPTEAIAEEAAPEEAAEPAGEAVAEEVIAEPEKDIPEATPKKKSKKRRESRKTIQTVKPKNKSIKILLGVVLILVLSIIGVVAILQFKSPTDSEPETGLSSANEKEKENNKGVQEPGQESTAVILKEDPVRTIPPPKREGELDPTAKARALVTRMTNNKEGYFDLPITMAYEPAHYQSYNVADVFKALDSWNAAVRWRVSIQIADRDLATTSSAFVTASKSTSPHLRTGCANALEELMKKRYRNRASWEKNGRALMIKVLPNMIAMLKDKHRMARIGTALFFTHFMRGGIDIMGDDRDMWRAKIGNSLLAIAPNEPDDRVCEAMIESLTAHGLVEKCDPATRNKRLSALLLAQPYPHGTGNAVRIIERLVNQKVADIKDFAPALVKLAETPCTQNTMIMPGGRAIAIKIMVEKKRWEILPALGMIINSTFIFRDPGLHWGSVKYEPFWKAIESLEKPQYKIIEVQVKKVVNQLIELNKGLKNAARFDKRKYDERQKFLDRLQATVRKNS
jgi:hypothetical protein